MRLRDTLGFRNIQAGVAGTQATHADSRASDEWIKNYLDKKNKRLNDLREELHNLLDFPEPVDIDSAYREDKKFPEQKPGSVGGFGPWCVVTPEGEILSRWPSQAQARNAAWGMYRGLKSSTGATAGAQVRRLDAGGPGSGRHKTVWHVTPESNRDSILKNGLRPGQSTPGSSTYGSNAIFFWKNKEHAEGWAEDLADIEPHIILKVNVPDGFYKKHFSVDPDSEDRSSVMSKKAIPAKWLVEAKKKGMDAGGPGSGCRGDSCGRPSSGKVSIKGGTAKQKKELEEAMSEIPKDHLKGLKNIVIKDLIWNNGQYDREAKTIYVSTRTFDEYFPQQAFYHELAHHLYSVAGKAEDIDWDDEKAYKKSKEEKFARDYARAADDRMNSKDLKEMNLKLKKLGFSPLTPYSTLQAADIFQDPDIQDKTRSQFKVLQHPKPRIVRDADTIRMGDNRPSSNGQGAAGTGGAGPGGGAGGGVGI